MAIFVAFKVEFFKTTIKTNEIRNVRFSTLEEKVEYSAFGLTKIFIKN